MQINLTQFYEVTNRLKESSGIVVFIKDTQNPSWHEVVDTALRLRDYELYDESLWCFIQVYNNYNNGLITASEQDVQETKSLLAGDIALCYSYKREFQKAIVTYQKAIELWPENAIAFSNLANTYDNMGDANGAMLYHKKAIEIDPTLVGSWNGIGKVLVDFTDKFEEAITYLDKAIELSDGQLGDALINKGIALQRLKKYDQAISCYDSAFEIDNQAYCHAMLNKATLLYECQNKPNEALELLNKVMGLIDNKNPYYFNFQNHHDKIKKSMRFNWLKPKSLFGR